MTSAPHKMRDTYFDHTKVTLQQLRDYTQSLPRLSREAKEREPEDGFDLIPPPSSTSDADRTSWSRLLAKIQQEFASDARVQSKQWYHDFQAGPNSKIPQDGSKFRSFGCKVKNHLFDVEVQPYVHKVFQFAMEEFGMERVRAWAGLMMDGEPAYAQEEIDECIAEYGSGEPVGWSGGMVSKEIRRAVEEEVMEAK